ncbi:hypothetical protein BB561_000590 [Smittium simulii]|uniref:Uncharacterized protein n=1 Tax=Smittium simulii TaxID=133385 RepID=A0A2T9YYI0_9FUNG|nr:hypothetical protein BB561_000590 [Smittium simulii]
MARIPRFHRGGRGSIPRIGGGSVAQWTRRLTTNQEIPDPYTNISLSIELEVAKSINGIHVTLALIVDNIKCSPIPLSQCPMDMEALVSRSVVG